MQVTKFSVGESAGVCIRGKCHLTGEVITETKTVDTAFRCLVILILKNSPITNYLETLFEFSVARNKFRGDNMYTCDIVNW